MYLRNKKLLINTLLLFCLFIFVLLIQFILARKQLDFGFAIDIWNLLALYRETVTNPVLDMLKAWKEIGSHNFAHTYYVGTLFDIFKYNYQQYNLFHQAAKALAAFSIFPVVYHLFKKKLLAVLIILIYAIHFSPFGALDDIARGADFFVIICMNLFLSLYIIASQKHSFNIKTLLLLEVALLAAAFLDITRFYPIILSLPLLEIVNFWLNRNSTSVKSIFLRLLFFYSPFLVVFIISPHSVLEQLKYYKPLWELLKAGNFQLLLSPLASLSSMFVPPQIVSLLGSSNHHSLEKFIFSNLVSISFIFYPIYVFIGVLITNSASKFIFRSTLISLFLSFLAFFLANQWLYLDPKTRSAVDPGVYFVSSLVGIFILSALLSLVVEYLSSGRKNPLLIGISLPVFLSLLYIIMTWILAPVNVVFTGVSAYLNIPAIGISISIGTILYLVYRKILSSNPNIFKVFIANTILLLFFFFFFVISSQTIDSIYSFWLKNGLNYKDQERIKHTFWQEIGKDKKFNLDNPAIIYIDNSTDYENGLYYSTAFIWKIGAYLSIETGETPPDCSLIFINDDIKKLEVRIVNGENVLLHNRCGFWITTKPSNFYAFRLTNRDIIPNRVEALRRLGINY